MLLQFISGGTVIHISDVDAPGIHVPLFLIFTILPAYMLLGSEGIDKVSGRSKDCRTGIKALKVWIKSII